MPVAFRRSPAHAWTLAIIAAVFATIGLAIAFNVARYGLDGVLHPALLLFAGVPLAAAAGLGFLAAKAFLRRPVLVALDADGVSLSGRPAIPWRAIGAVVVTENYIGYGPHQVITLRRRFTPSDVAATGAERLVHNLFTDRSFAPPQIDRTVEEMLAEIDAGLAAAGFGRVELPKRRFRGVFSSRSWTIERAKK